MPLYQVSTRLPDLPSISDLFLFLFPLPSPSIFCLSVEAQAKTRRVMALYTAGGSKKKQESDVAADKKAKVEQQKQQQQQQPLLNRAAGEEITGLTKDEMATVCDKLEQFARKNPHRVKATNGNDGSSRRERRK